MLYDNGSRTVRYEDGNTILRGGFIRMSFDEPLVIGEIEFDKL